MTTVLGTSWGQFTVKQDANRFPTHGMVLAMISDGAPVRVEGDNLAHELWLTPAAILTVTKVDE